MRRRVLVRLAAVAVALCAVGTVAPSAGAGQGNRAATSAYLRAVYRFDHATYINRSAWRRKTEALVSSVAAGCKGVLANAPRGTDLRHLQTEAALTPLVVFFKTNRGAVRTFLHVIEGLRWTNPRVNRAVRAELNGTKWLYRVRMPDLCADARAWAATGYRQLSSGTTSFVDEFLRALFIEVGSQQEAPAQLVSRYEGPGARRLARRLQRLQTQLNGATSRILEPAAAAILRDLGVRKRERHPLRELPSAVETVTSPASPSSVGAVPAD
jgi:hypothetical protein